MEQSRFLLSSRLYIIGLACLLLGIILIGVSFYLVPVVFFDYSLDLPTTFFKLLHWCDLHWALSEDQIMRLIWIIIFLLGFLLILFADMTSNYIDKKLLARGKRVRNMEKNMIDIRQILFILLASLVVLFLCFKLVDHHLFIYLPKK